MPHTPPGGRRCSTDRPGWLQLDFHRRSPLKGWDPQKFSGTNVGFFVPQAPQLPASWVVKPVGAGHSDGVIVVRDGRCVNRGGAALEIGCGEGRALLELQQQRAKLRRVLRLLNLRGEQPVPCQRAAALGLGERPAAQRGLIAAAEVLQEGDEVLIVDALRLRATDGRLVPLSWAARQDRARGLSKIERRDSRRVVVVSADVDGNRNQPVSVAIATYSHDAASASV